MLTLGVHVFSTEYTGANRNYRSLWGAQFGEEFGEVLQMRIRPAVKAAGPTASGNLVVDRTVHNISEKEPGYFEAFFCAAQRFRWASAIR